MKWLDNSGTFISLEHKKYPDLMNRLIRMFEHCSSLDKKPYAFFQIILQDIEFGKFDPNKQKYFMWSNLINDEQVASLLEEAAFSIRNNISKNSLTFKLMNEED